MFIPPMLLQYAKNNEPIDDPSIFAELKWDGIRLIVSNDGRIRQIGTMELGITESARKSMRPVFQAYKSQESKDHVFIQPLVRCKVKYRDWYKSGLMRLPVFEEFIV